MSTRTSLTTTLAAALLVFLSYALPAAAAGPTTLSAAQLNDAFRSYGDASGLWNGGDGTASVKLPDGRVVWLFSDTFIGPIGADGSRAAGQTMVHNSMVVQQDGVLNTTLIGGTADEPLSLVGSASDVDPGDAGHWVGDAIVEGSTLQVLYNNYHRTGDGPLDVRLTGTALASFDLPALTLRTLTRLPSSSRIAWGSAILEDGTNTYIYGAGMADDLGSIKPVYLAKAARGQISGAWQFWTGTGWSAREADAGALMSGVGTAFGVQKVGSEYVLVTMDSNRAFNPDVVAYRASSATGPFTGPIPLLRAPEPQSGRQIIAYDVHVHPEWAASGKLLVSYNVNSLDANDNIADARLYRPRFVEITWPPPVLSGLPAAPPRISATANTQGAVHLTWNAVAGASGYRIHQLDVAAGQSHFMRLASTVAGTSYDVAGLVDGHLYEFSVSAVNSVGEGARGATVSAVARTTAPEPGKFQSAPAGTAVTGAYLVDLKDNAANGESGVAAIAARLVATYGGHLEDVYAAVLGGFSVIGMTDAQARALAADPAVASVEESRAAKAFASDPGTQQDAWWGLDRIDGTVDGKYVYPSTGQGARIYVVDTGIRTTHNEFGGRAFPFSNHWHDPNDNGCKEHGTFVAGVAAGSTYGVAKKASVFDVQGSCTGSLGSAGLVVAALNSIARNGQPGSVVNISLGFQANTGGGDSIETAVKQLIGRGFTVVVAAGNEYWSDACDGVPAKVPEAITVASIGSGDVVARTSNIGKCVDLFAPGENIGSASNIDDSESGTDSGTSLAAPHVAGAAALILAAHPTYSPDDVREALVGLAEIGKVKGPIGDSPNRLLHVDVPLPTAPTNLTATAGTDGTIALAWQPVIAKGVNYLVSQRDVTAEQAWFRWTNPIRTGTTATATDLEPGHAYEFTVAAANEMAVSPESNVANAKASLLPPPAPTGLTATAKSGGVITLTWKAPGPDLWYWMYQRDVTPGQTEDDFTRLPLPITTCCTMDAGYLEQGHEYEYVVSAINRAGEGPRSTPARAVATYDPPPPPTNLRATAGDGQATLTWDPVPGDVWYLVYQRDASNNQDWQQLSIPVTTCCTMTAGYLANGNTYEFKVTATASGRESAASNVVGVRPLPPLPAAPANLRAAPQDSGDIELTWDALPTDVYYWVYWRVASSGEDFTKSKYPTDGTTATIGSLTNGTVYELKVTAENIAGEGPASTSVQARSHVALPEAPKFLDARANENLQIELSWLAPGPNMYYWIYSRNVSAKETGFTKSKYPTTATKATVGPLTAGDHYEYKVTAENAAGEGPASNTADATAIGTVPARPGTLSATPGNGSVRLNWGASPTPNVGYWVYYRDAGHGQAWQRQKYPVLDCCTHTVELLTNGNNYEFKMTAGNAAGESAFTNTVSARPLPPSPQPPSNLRATAGNGAVTLAWHASPTPSVYYWIEYRVSGGTWKRAKYPVTKCCTFTVGYLANGTSYDFRVRATNVAGDSAPSNVDSARPLPPFPQAPSNLSAAPGDGKVTLRWNGSPTAGVYYVIDYRKVGGAWKRMPYPVTTCCTFTVSYLLNGTTYEFRVRATNLAGESGATNTARARPMPPMPQAPSNLRAAVGLASGTIKLNWSASHTAKVYYYVYQRNQTLHGRWQRMAYPVVGTSMIVSYLAPGHIYQFKVTAVNLTGESRPTNIASAMARYADGTTRYARVTSSWILDTLDDIEPIQRYDITGDVRGTREGNYIVLRGGWHLNNGKQLLDGIFWYNIVDCTEGGSVKHGVLGYETPTSITNGAITFQYRMNPRNTYKVTVTGGGDITFSGAIYGRFSRMPSAGIIPFIAETPCF